MIAVAAVLAFMSPSAIGGGGVGTGDLGGGGIGGVGHKRSANCFPVGDDATAEIQACINARKHVVLPSGDFVVSGNPCLTVPTDNGSLRGVGSSSTRIVLTRNAGGFSASRMVFVTGDNVLIDRLTLDGGMGARTCEEVKNEIIDGGPGIQGQQQHAIFVSGRDAPVVGFRLGADLKTVGISGDALFLYNEVSDVTIADRTVDGFCRSGITMNSYTADGINHITIRDVDISPSAVAQDSARGMDFEPNAYMSDITIQRVRTNRIEGGAINRLTLDQVTIEARNGIPANGMLFASIFDSTISNSTILNTVVGSPALRLNKSSNVTVRDTVISQMDAANYGIHGTNSGATLIGPLTFDNVTIDTDQDTAIRLEIAELGVVVKNSTLVGDYGINFFGKGSLTVTDTDFTAAVTAIHVRPVTGELDSVAVSGATGTSPTAVFLNSAVGTFTFCNSTLTGTHPTSDPCP